MVVSDPVHADPLGVHPGEVSADASPEMVVPAASDRLPAPVTQQLPVWRGVALSAVLDQAAHQGGRDRLPADRLAFFPQPDQALVRIQIIGAQRQRAASAACFSWGQTPAKWTSSVLVLAGPLSLPPAPVASVARLFRPGF